ncbi:hypothetical protein PVK06_042578 [Gossypium arboreum]|uniref:DUF4220 domain-containing protein n=1 Tax=Gossypium arboreum TaxID=29729 RepID=A0ABR0MN76_GOSAR|nr:hypothetical protein PVK06_042578 [Gossypium arboreum]
MATIVLSTLLKTHAGLQPRDELVAFWSPFVLWHLGGPYNITAYSLEDNAQWLRYFFGFVLQAGEEDGYDEDMYFSKSIDAKTKAKRILRTLYRAYTTFSIFKPVFLDLPFELSAEISEVKVYLAEPEEEAFKMVDIGLDFFYDLLFTKLPIQYGELNLTSLALRIFCLGSAVSSLLAFFITPKPHIPRVDVAITYCLLR